ncbi:MAG: TetR family transcriptional regulator [Deltaproteobacteria bacterium]|nr:TetR family transcriptional regulator [Deltaproteobacteria bacterium]
MRKFLTTIKKPELVARRRSQIMAAAMNLFRKQGYHATTMRQICEESQVNRGSFYDYFRSKEDILVYIYKEMMYEAGDFDRTFPELKISGWKDLEPFVRYIARNSWERNRSAIQLLYRETISLDRKTMREVLRVESGYIKWVAENLRRGLKLPKINKKLEILANTIVYLNAFLPLRGWNMHHLDPDEVLDSVVELVMMKLEELRPQP